MRPKKNQLVFLMSTTIHDPYKKRDLLFFVEKDRWESFNNSNSFVKKVEIASRIQDKANKNYLKDEYKNTVESDFMVTNIDPVIEVIEQKTEHVENDKEAEILSVK